MKINFKNERAAWTAYITGEPSPKPSKYRNQRTGGFASKHEAEVALKLDALQRSGQIFDFQMQVPIVLVPGKDDIQGIIYIADFVYRDKEGKRHVLDAKSKPTMTPVYRLKKRLAKLLLDIEIEEA